MINSSYKARQPVPSFPRKLPIDLGNGAAEIEDSQRVIKIQANPAHCLADAAESEAPQDLHLAKPEMRVNKAQSDGEIVVVFSLYERDLMAVPVNLDPAFNAYALT